MSHHRTRVVATVLTAGLSAVFLLSAPPATADASATVKARTQKMSGPNLNSRQNGWYNVGDRLTLVCSERGQKVKGFFSFNIPGGWDDLWYKTSDGSYVADVDIETGTLNVVAPACGTQNPGGPAPAARSGSLRLPLDGNPGISRGYGGPDRHNGVDYRVATGTPVYAADSGTVAFEGYGQNHSWMREEAGICVLLKHGERYTGYAHLSRTVIDNDQQVSKGQLIGYSGETGQAYGQHLHFEVLPLNPDFGNGFSGRIDPAPLLG